MIVARTSRELTAIVERVIGDHAAGEGFGTKTHVRFRSAVIAVWANAADDYRSLGVPDRKKIQNNRLVGFTLLLFILSRKGQSDDKRAWVN